MALAAFYGICVVSMMYDPETRKVLCLLAHDVRRVPDYAWSVSAQWTRAKTWHTSQQVVRAICRIQRSWRRRQQLPERDEWVIVTRSMLS